MAVTGKHSIRTIDVSSLTDLRLANAIGKVPKFLDRESQRAIFTWCGSNGKWVFLHCRR